MSNDIIIDVGAVRAEIARHKIKKTVLARNLKITPPALARRLNEEVPFSAEELAYIAKVTYRSLDFYIKS